MEPDDDSTRTHVPLTNGTMVSHYRIIEKIGAGGMGEVYLAEDTELNRKVALKFLPPHLCQDADCRARFKREAQAAAKLNHSNIVTIYEVSEFQGRPFFAMEHLEGQTLHQLNKQREMSLSQAVDIAIQICDGLQEAHAAGIIHRDIKPSNVIIDRKLHSTILDFGLAAVQGDDKLTKTGSTLGTVNYMSPEQTRGEDVDHRSDIFSLGVVLYEMITGHLPFKRDQEPSIIHAIGHEEPEPLARYKSGVPETLQRIVSKALAKDKNLRYQHADDLLADLRALSAETSMAVRGQAHRDWWNRYVVIGAAAVLLVIAGYWALTKFGLIKTGEKSSRKKMLVVLPFQNLGNAEDEYFADGITDEITSRLGVIKGLGVISRTSAMQYKNTTKGLPQIAKELAVDYVLEGTIRWDKVGDTDLVRITPQLIKASDNTHIWAGNYERPLKSVFAVQADIATRIADTLGLTLLEPERRSLEAKPTNNLEAYNLYLRGREYWQDTRTTGRAIQMLEKAVALDSSFYQASSLLVRLYGYAYINNIQGGKERLGQAKAAAERAFRLADGQSDGYLALGSYYYFFSRDYDRALELYYKALEGQPNNSELLASIAYVQRRQGKWAEAAENLQKAFQLDPASVDFAEGLCRTFFYMHRPIDAEIVIDRSLELAPDNEVLLMWKTAFAWYKADTSGSNTFFGKLEQVAERPFFAYWAEVYDLLRRDYRSALGRRTSPGGYELNDSTDFYLSKAQLHGFLNEPDLSGAYYDSARVVCEGRIKAQVDNAWVRGNLAQAYAGLGRKQDAIREGKKAAELLPVSEDALSGTWMLFTLATVYMMVGEYDLAIDQLEYLISIPSFLQVEELRMHPTWDPLRNHPRFKALLAKYGS
jgi:TolB-like protein/Tfp pilus assembly protein PilF